MTKNARMNPANLVAMLLVVAAVGTGVGLILGPSFNVIGGAPAWTRGVFVACCTSSGLLFLLDRRGSVSDLKPLGLAFAALVLLMAVSGVDSGQGEGGLSGAISDAKRDLLIYVGLVLMPVFILIQHVSQVYTRWRAGQVGLKGRS